MRFILLFDKNPKTFIVTFHRVIAIFWVGRDLKGQLVQPPAIGGGTPFTDQAAQSPVQLGLDGFQHPELPCVYHLRSYHYDKVPVIRSIQQPFGNKNKAKNIPQRMK